MSTENNTNKFVHDNLASVFAKTAIPIIFVMLVNGSFSLLDAYFLGVFVGAEALTAVTSMFPFFMFIIALSTLVSTGFASVMARALGANEQEKALESFSQAVTLALFVCGVLIGLFFILGSSIIALVSNGSSALYEQSYTYMSIIIICSPLMFVLAINGDSLRSEGKISFMTIVSLLSVLLNGIFNYLLIVKFDYGVAGSAYGTVLAQAFSIVAVAIYRLFDTKGLKSQVLRLSLKTNYWKEFLALGAPSSLTYVGLALSSGAILYNLQVWGGGSFETTVGAYGIITRLMTFVFLPMLGLGLAFQTLMGNNVGAKQWGRANQIIKIALCTSLIYSLSLQIIIVSMRHELGALFVEDMRVIDEVVRIIPMSTLALFLFGPLMIISMFFQSIGDAKRAGVLGLTKTYCFSLPLIFILPFALLEPGIWYAGPTSELLALLLTSIVLYRRSREDDNYYGLFFKNNEKTQQVLI